MRWQTTTSQLVRKIFREWDANGDGLISRKELLDVFETLDPTFPLNELDDLLVNCDKNKDGKISYDEFVNNLWPTTTGCEVVEEPTAEAKVEGVLEEERILEGLPLESCTDKCENKCEERKCEEKCDDSEEVATVEGTQPLPAFMQTLS